MADEAARPLLISVVCEGPPPAGACAGFGLQDADGTLTAGTALPDGSLQFTMSAEIRGNGAKVRLRGPHVRSPADAPFVYLSCRAHDGGWRFRLKVPLAGLTELLAAAPPGRSLAASCRVRATGGGAVPLIEEWTVRDAAAPRAYSGGQSSR
jgi:hypothetical protein